MDIATVASIGLDVLALAGLGGVIWRWRRTVTAATRERIYRAAFEDSRDGLFLLDEERRFVAANEKYLELIGRSLDEVIGQPFDSVGGAAKLTGMGPTQLSKTATIRVRRIVGDATIELSWSRVEHDGRVFTVGRARDVSEKVRDQEREQVLRAALDATEDAIFLFKLGSGVIWRNRACETWLQDEVGLLERIERKLGETPGTGHSSKLEVEVGRGAHHRVGTVHLATAGGDLVVGVIRDVTDERKAERRRKSAEARLYEAQRMESLGVLAGGLAHDFNNLLTGILGFTTLARDAQEPALAKKMLDSAVKSAEKASGLTRQLREFSQSRSGEFAVVDLDQVVAELEPFARRVLGESIDLVVERPCAETPILCDATQIRQLVLNLVIRAREALRDRPRGTIAVRLGRVDLAEDEAAARGLIKRGPYVRLEVEDDGKPIDAAQRKHLFEPFSVGKTLAIPATYGIVVRHQGAIEVDATPSGRTLFSVFLPAESRPVAVATPVAAGAPAESRARRVIVADDDPLIVELAVSILRAAGFEVEPCSDGARALELLRASPEAWDLVLSDVIMPGISGVEFVADARRIAPRVRVLLMTGYSDVSLPPGIPVIEKPFDPAGLERRVREALGLPTEPKKSAWDSRRLQAAVG